MRLRFTHVNLVAEDPNEPVGALKGEQYFVLCNQHSRDELQTQQKSKAEEESAEFW